MKILDITLLLKEGMRTYPGDPAFQRRVVSSLKDGDFSEVSLISFGSHTGTHVDVPAHMIDGGPYVEEIPLDVLIGPACVCDLTQVEGLIEPCHFSEIDFKGVERILFCTRNSVSQNLPGEFDENFCALSGDAAEFLVEKGMKLVGIDGLSVDRFKSGTHPAHMALLGAGVVVIEGLNLYGVMPGKYDLICAPLKIYAGDGAPARVFLVKE